MMSKIEVARFVERHKMNMSVRNINTNYGLTDLDARTHFLQPASNFTGKKMEINKEIVVKVEDIVHLLFGDTEHMTFHYRVHIKEREEILRFGNFIARYLTRYNTRKNGCHGICFILFNKGVVSLLQREQHPYKFLFSDSSWRIITRRGRQEQKAGLTLDREDLEIHLAGRDYNLNLVASFLTQESLCKRRRDRYLALLEVGLTFGNDLVRLLHIVLYVADIDTRKEQDLRGINLRLVKKACIGNQFLKFRDTSLQMALGLFCRIILCILGQIALVACLCNSGGSSRTVKSDKMMKFIF